LPDFAQVELWDFYQFLLQKYQAKTEQEDLEDYELDKIVKARQVKKPFAVEVSLNNL